MEPCIDFLNLLGQDVAFKIMSNLDDPSDIARACAVSHAWQEFVIDNGLSKQLCLKKFPQLLSIARVEMVVSGTAMVYAAGSSSSTEWESKKRDHLVFLSLAHEITSSTSSSSILEAIKASSTDNYPQENIANTLEPRDRIDDTPSYWSSKGQSNLDVPETLMYRLKSNLCVIKEIFVRPFEAYFQHGHPIYSSKFVRFRLGHPKFSLALELGGLCGVPLEDITDQKFVWTYTSPEFPMTQENKLQQFQLPEPALCVGGILQIELLGRIQKQEMDDMYYVCVSHVRADGLSLSPRFNLKTLENSDKFILEYNLQEMLHSPQRVDDSPESGATDERALQNWGQFMNLGIINMLQAYVPGYQNQGEGAGAGAGDDTDEDEFEVNVNFASEDGQEDEIGYEEEDE